MVRPTVFSEYPEGATLAVGDADTVNFDDMMLWIRLGVMTKPRNVSETYEILRSRRPIFNQLLAGE